MAVFGDYQIGGISAALGQQLGTKDDQRTSDKLKSLFNTSEKHVTVCQEQDSSKLPEGLSSKKRRLDGKESSQPSRKKQRENRKEKKAKKRAGESDGADVGDKSISGHFDKRIKTEENKVIADEKDDPDRLARTIFVGNIPVDTTRKELREFFKSYGDIETVRLRSVPVASLKQPKKVSVIKKEFHPDRETMNSYIVFKDEKNATKALQKNGKEYKGLHLRVTSAEKKEPDNKLSIFVGNLPFKIQEEQLWKHFEKCGNIDGVRVIRDQESGMGKGFAYVAFKKEESVTFALRMRNTELLGRRIRVFGAVGKDSVKKPFDKKKDKQFRMKDVSSQGRGKDKDKGRKLKPGLRKGIKSKDRNRKANFSKNIVRKNKPKK
eukprot:gene12128-13380_t